MKRILLGVAVLLSVTTLASAKEHKAKAPVKGHKAETSAAESKVESAPAGSNWYWGLGLDMDAPVNNFAPGVNLGMGARLTGGYSLDKGLAVQLSAENLFYSASGASVYDLRLIPEVKGSLEMGGWKAYLLWGPGLDIESASGLSVSSFDMVFGPGAQFEVGDGTDFFLEWDFNFIYASGETGMDMPLLAGLNFKI